MKRWLCAICAGLLLLACCGCKGKTDTAPADYASGNRPNGGAIIATGEADGSLYVSMGDGLYKMSADLQDKRLLAPVSMAIDLNLYGNWIYCWARKDEEYGIFRIKTDGSSYEFLFWGEYPLIYEDKLYYICTDERRGTTNVYVQPLSSLTNDPLAGTCLVEGETMDRFQIYENQLYVCGYIKRDPTIARYSKYDLNGKHLEDLGRRMTKDYQVYQGNVYSTELREGFLTSTGGSAIYWYWYRSNGEGEMEMVGDKHYGSEVYNIYKDEIYFLRYAMTAEGVQSTLEKCDLNGDNMTVLGHFSTPEDGELDVYIVNNHVYLYNVDTRAIHYTYPLGA